MNRKYNNNAASVKQDLSFPSSDSFIPDSLYNNPETPIEILDDSFAFSERSDVLLDSNKSYSNSLNNDPEYCPNCFTYCEILIQKPNIEIYKRVRVRCKSWDCPYCKKINQFILKNNLYHGFNAVISEYLQDGFRPEYYCKFLTLTVPGQDYRNTHTPEQAEQDIKNNFNKLRTALKKTASNFSYFWVREYHQDGYPHLHVVLVGKNIARASIYESIRKLWCTKYGMGFIKLNIIKGGVSSICRYVSKYATKDMISNGKNKNNYHMSKDLQSKIKEFKEMAKLNITILEYGKIERDSSGKESFIPLWSRKDRPELSEELKKKIIHEVDDAVRHRYDLQALLFT